MDEGEIRKFYNENKNSYSDLYNIKTADDLIGIVKQCKQIYSDGESYYKTVELLMNTYKEESGHIKCDFEVKFNNNKELNCRFDLSKDKNNNVITSFQPAQ